MCFGGREDVEAKKSREIDALIHRDEKVMQKVVKLLLLGEPDLGSREPTTELTIDRCRRERKVDDTEADATDLYQGRLQQKREGRMADHYIQQHPRWPTHHNRCHARVWNRVRVHQHLGMYPMPYIDFC